MVRSIHTIALTMAAAFVFAACQKDETSASAVAVASDNTSEVKAMTEEAPKPAVAAGEDPKTWTDEQWRERLTPEEFRVLREHGTERAFTGDYYASKNDGVYLCAGCGQELFDSQHKFDSGTGWPSYFLPIDEEAVGKSEDSSFGMVRVEVHCSRCGGHLGHVFEDGPEPTGLRYCINSASLDFKPREEGESESE